MRIKKDFDWLKANRTLNGASQHVPNQGTEAGKIQKFLILPILAYNCTGKRPISFVLPGF